MNEQKLVIPVVLGSVRSRRQSLRPGHLLQQRAVAAGHQSELVDLRELDLPVFGQQEGSDSLPSVRAFKRAMDTADAVVWLTPEYNHSFTSATKNAVDYLHPELRRKPVAVCGLSGGNLGGARAVEQLKLVMIEMHALPIRDSVYFSDARSIFDHEGTLLREEFIRRIDEMLAELAWYAQALKWGRENVELPAHRR